MPNVNFYSDLLRQRSGDIDFAARDMITRGVGPSRSEFTKGGTLFGRGVETLGQPLSYYQGLLGNRQEALTAAAPEISSIQGQFNTAAKAVSEFSPRGGGRTAASAELPFAKQAAVQDVITKQRPEAAKGISEIGKLLADLGLSQEQMGGILAQLGISEEQLSLQAFESGAGLTESQQARKDKLYGTLGQAVGGTIIAGILI